MKTLAILSAVGAAAILSGCADDYAPHRMPMAYAGPKAADACFYTRDIRNHTVADDHTLYLSLPANRVVRVTTDTNCLSGAFPSDALVIRTPPSSPRVCQPIDLDLGIRKPGFTARCIVQGISELTPAEVAALPPALRP